MAADIDFYADPRLAIGSGFDSLAIEALGDCVTRTDAQPAAGVVGERQMFLMQQVENYASLSQTLALSASASLKAEVFSVDGRAGFFQSLNMNDYSLWLVVTVLVQQPSRVMRDVELTKDASDLYSSHGPAAFRERCGDEYVSGLITGGEFRSVIEIDTHSQEEKDALSAAIGGSYKIFSGSAELESTLTKILSTNKTQVYAYVSGGTGQVIQIDPKDMLYQATHFAATIQGEQAAPVNALTAPYRTLKLPDGPAPLDISNQMAFMQSASKSIADIRQAINNIDYITYHPEEFVEPNMTVLAETRNQLAANYNTIRASASTCYRDLNKCEMPQLAKVDLSLPQRQPTTESSCPEADRVYKTRADAVCGTPKYNVGRGEPCGAELFNEGVGQVCGVASFLTGTGNVCGVKQANLSSGKVCGPDMATLLLSDSRGKIQQFEVHDGWCRSIGYEGALDNVGREAAATAFEASKRMQLREARACFHWASCRDPSFGVEYNTCENKDFGVKEYKSCQNEIFGVKQYKECENGLFGVAEYISCEKPEFGFDHCRRS